LLLFNRGCSCRVSMALSHRLTTGSLPELFGKEFLCTEATG
jgi:hypothetical protein